MTKRDAILNAISPLFAEHGYGLVGIDTLAAKAEVTKRTLYRYFRSKSGLFEAWLQHRDAEIRETLFASVEKRVSTPRAQVLAVFDMLARLADAPAFHGCPFSRTLLEPGDALTVGRQIATKHKMALREWFADRLNAAAIDEPDARAEELLMLYEGVLQRTAATRSRLSADAARRLIALRWPE